MQNKHADLALDQIVVSQTNKLFRDEADFTPAALNELAESIKKTGVYSPILVRPNPDKEKSKSVPYELIFGERRLHASRVAGVATIPAIIREMTDDEALEAQVVENLQRENVNPMKEARAFQWMEKTKKMSSKQIADRIGKSADYVQERVRLNTLIKEAQELVAAGSLPLKAALKLTRVPEKKQKDCLDDITASVEGVHGKQIVFRGMDEMSDWLDRHLFYELAKADFSTDDAKLVPNAGSCTTCLKRTKNTGGLFDDIVKTDQCLDSVCYHLKQLAAYAVLKKELTEKFPGYEIVYCNRGPEIDAFKKLQPRIETYVGEQISGAEAAKAEPKDVVLVIMIGTSWHDQKIKLFEWRSLKKNTGSRGPVKLTQKEKEEQQKRKDDSDRIDAKVNFEEQLQAEHFAKKGKVLKPEAIRIAIGYVLAETYEYEKVLPILKALQIDWFMTKPGAGDRQLMKANDTNLSEVSKLAFDNDDLQKSISKVPIDQLYAILGYVIYQFSFNEDRKMIAKVYSLDEKTINKKAQDLTSEWWKNEVAKRKEKQAAKPAKKIEPKKKSKVKKS